MQLASLAGIVACAIFAGQVATIISPYIISLTNASPHILKPLSYVSAFILIMVGFIFLGRMIQGILETIKLKSLNKLAGGVFSSAKWLIVISILLNIIVEIDKSNKIIKDDVRQNSHSYPYIKKLTPYFIPFLEFDSHSEKENSK